LLDEPLASLDTRLKNQILPFLRRIKDEIRIPMVYVSHAINEILYLTTQVVMISDGEVLACGSFHEVISDERVLTMAHTLGLENVAHCKVIEHNFGNGYTTAVLGTQHLYIPLVQVPINSLVSVSITASNIALSGQRLSGVTIQNQLYGTVTNIHHVADRVLISIDAGSMLVAEITSKALRDMGIEKGTAVYCLIKTQSIFPLVQMP
jgi:molybdate transport system ATP-binding protein